MFTESATYKLPEKHRMEILEDTIRNIERNGFLHAEQTVPVYNVNKADDDYLEIEADGGEWFYIETNEEKQTLTLGVIDEEADGTWDEHLQFCDGQCDNVDGVECAPRIGIWDSESWNMLDAILTKLGYKESE